MIITILILLSTIVGNCYGGVRYFKNGRPHDGFVGEPYVENVDLLATAEPQWFTQKLNHFAESDTRTWKQQYFVNGSVFKPNGPVFLMIGGEGRLSPLWVKSGAMVDYAVECGALMLGLEHRFYGDSHPLNDTSVESLKYLSSEQALADLATFHRAMVHQFSLTHNNRWIAFGGSYPGALAAWFRYKYPHLIYGSVASSAPIQAQLDFPEYFEVSTKSLGSVQCRASVKDANKKIEEYMKSEAGLKYLSYKFRLCERLTANVYDLMQLSESLANNFFGVIQYNKDNRLNSHQRRSNSNITIDILCGIMTNLEIGDAIDRYAAVNDMMMKLEKEKCLDVSYKNFIKFYKETSWSSLNAKGGRQWQYQTCTEMGYYQTTDSTHQVFGTSIPLNFFIKQCIDIYGDIFNKANIKKGIAWTNDNYGGYEMGKSASRIIFPNGSIDPWHALSFLKSEGDIIAIYIKGTAHCANMYPAGPNDPQELKDARQKIGAIVKEWLASP